jgi:hypothetical protein
MAMASGLYVATVRDALKNTIALDATSTANKIALYANTLTPNFNADPSSYSSTSEVTGTGYTAGGLVTASSTFAVSAGNLTFDQADVTWTGVTITARGAVEYADGLTPKANIFAIDFGADFPTVAGNFTIQWNPSGIWTLDLVP